MFINIYICIYKITKKYSPLSKLNSPSIVVKKSDKTLVNNPGSIFKNLN